MQQCIRGSSVCPMLLTLWEEVYLLLVLPGEELFSRYHIQQLLAWLGRRRRVLAGSDELIVSFFIKGGNVYGGAFLRELTYWFSNLFCSRHRSRREQKKLLC